MTQDTFITLVKRELADTPDDSGNPVYTETKRRVHAKCDGVKRNEFYQAAAAGLKPLLVFRVYERVYGGEKYIEYKNTRYRVIRTYPLSGERLEIVVTDDLQEGAE